MNTKALNLSAACLGLGLPLMVLGNIPVYLVLIVALAAGFIGVGSDARLGELRRLPMAAVGAFLLWLGLCSAMGINPGYSISKWAVIVAMAVVGCGFYLTAREFDEARWRRFLTALSDAVLASYILIALTFIVDPWFIAQGYYLAENTWIAYHLRFYSSVLAVILPFCWVWWLRKPDGRLRLDTQALLAIGASMIACFICAGRAGWIGLAGGGVLLAVLLVRHHGLRIDVKRAALTLGTAGALAFALYVWLFGVSSIQERLGIITPDRGLGGGRLDIWAMAWRAFTEHPVAGIGVNAFQFLPGADAHPHNFVMQLLAESGVVGLLLALSLLAYALAKLVQASARNALVPAGAAGLLGFMLAGLMNKSFFNPEWMIYLSVILALGFAAMRAPLAGLVVASARPDVPLKMSAAPTAPVVNVPRNASKAETKTAIKAGGKGRKAKPPRR